jgi:hypothetical protein
MEHRHLAVNREMEDRFRAINRGMELSHQAVEYEMADRHRLATQREQDEDIAHSRAIGHASAIGGLAESILTGSPLIGKSGANLGPLIPGEYIMQLRNQMAAGAKAMGLPMGTARTLVGEGVLSPGSLIQAGEEQRQDIRKEAAREREKEDILTNRWLQKEGFDERIKQEDELHAKTIANQNEEIATREKLEDRRRELSRKLQDDERVFRHKTEDEQFNLAYDNAKKLRDYQQETIIKNFNTSIATMDALSHYMEAKGLGPLLKGPSESTPAPGEKPSGLEKILDKVNGNGGATEDTLKKVQETLDKVFTGSGG